MKRIYRLILSAGLVSCTGLASPEHLHAVRVYVSDEGEGTKACGINADSEFSVNTVQIFVFNEDGSLETQAFTEVEDGAFSLELKVGEGNAKRFHAVVNRAEMEGISSEEALLADNSLLSENRIGSLVMTGYSEMDIVSDCSVTIHVKRLAAKVRLDGIELKMDGGSHDRININSIFLTNVNSAISLGGNSPAIAQEWLNRRGYAPSSCDSILYEACGTTLENGEHDERSHTFYCYPNPFVVDSHDVSGTFSERCTRLVMDTDMGFYHIDLCCQGGIESNHVYTIKNIIITRPGGESPEEEAEDAPLTFGFSVLDWDDAQAYDEII